MLNEELTKLLEKRLPTEEEIVELRKLMEQDKRIKWFWSTARTCLIMLSAMVYFFTVGFDGLRTILKRFLE